MKLCSTLILVFLIAGSLELSAQCQLNITGATPPSCPGGPNGTLTVFVSSGTAPYQFAWTGPVSGTDGSNASAYVISPLPAGNYSITVTDNTGCTAETSGAVTGPAPIGLTVGVTHLSCYGNASGAIDLGVTGGTPNYTYHWSNNANTQDISGLSIGTYRVTVTDVHGCTKTTSATVTQPPNLFASRTITPADCAQSNGAINVVPNGGTSPYAFLWSNNAVTEDLNNIPAGIYSITVTDANGCTQTNSATVSQLPDFSLGFTQTPSNCADSTGTLNLTVTGGTAPFTYSWNNGRTTEDLDSMPGGFYFVAVTSAPGCTANGYAFLASADGPFITLTPTNANCFPGGTGSINLTVTGGTPGYQFLWSNGETGLNLNNVQPGTYHVTVIDATGCANTESAVIGQGILMTLTTAVTNVGCYGQQNGIINLTVTGGVPPFTYYWSDTTFDEDIANGIPGEYCVTVTDSQGCSATTCATIQEPAPLDMNFTKTDVACSGGADGAIDLTVTGGAAPYSFLWSNFFTVPDLSGIPAGAYCVTVTDNNGCSLTTCVTVNQPASLVFSSAVIPASCTGTANGAIDLSASGGTAGYVFLWNTGSSSQDLTNITAGTYTATITDANACTDTYEVVVPAGDSPVATNTGATPVSACGVADGSLSVDLANAAPPFGYAWSNGAGNGAESGLAAEPFTIGNLAAGVYQFTVTDGNGCSVVAGQVIGSPMNLVATPAPISACQNADGSIEVAVSGALPDYAYSWERGTSTGSGSSITAAPFNLTNLEAGAYRISVTNTAGCFALTTAEVAQSDLISLNVDVAPVSCPGGADGNADLSVSGGVPPYGYVWSSGGNTEDLTDVPAGVYTVVVTDANGCTAQAAAEILAPDPVVIQLVVTPVACNGASTGSIDASVLGGTPGYTYAWSNNASSKDLNNLAAGIYTVTVTDNQGCTQANSAAVSQAPPSFSVSFSVTPATGCLTADGAIDVNVTGGIPDFAYTWNNGVTTGSGSNISSTQFQIGGLNPGNYTLTVINGDACTTSLTATVGTPVFDASVFVTPASCDGMAPGAVQVTIVTGKVPNYAYQWTSGASSGSGNNISTTPFTVPNLPVGNYSITVTNGSGCSAQRQFAVNPANMAVFVGPSNASCGQPLGYLNITVNNAGNAPPYTYSWFNGATSGNGSAPSTPFNITGLLPATYSITLTNALGCTATQTATITPGAAMFNLASSAEMPTCFGGANGKLNLNINSGSTAPYTYNWSNGIVSGSGVSAAEPFQIAGLTAGNYNVTVSDAGGCTGSVSQTINQPAAPSFSANTQAVSCFGAADGQIDISFSGPNPPFLYNWTGPNGFVSAQADLSGLSAGLYALTVSNALGCTGILPSIEVGSPAQLTATVAAGECGYNTAFAVPGGGTIPYTFLWSNNAVSDTITGLSTGQYAVTVTDAHGCTAVDTAFIQTDINLCGLIGGGVYEDIISNCLLDNEPPLAGWLVKATGLQTYYAMTGVDGQFLMHVAPGDYTLDVVAPDPAWLPCSTTSTVSVTQPDLIVDAGALLVGREALCPAMYVNLASTFLRRCSGNNAYQIQYCNNGTANADNVYLDVALDPLITAQTASKPFTALGNNVIRFQLGTVVPGDCGQISLQVYVSCNAVLGQTHCTEAHIYPDTLCLPPNANWSGASIQLRGECDADSVRFVLKNSGSGNLANTLGYIVIEDHVMLMQGEVDALPAGDSLGVSFPANGSTWRMEAEQEVFHPGQSMPVASVEGCTSTGSFSTGFVTQFPVNNQDPWIDIDCQQNIGAWDPNDKRGFPVGYGSEHYIRPGTAIQYVIRFQNTGTDTAFNIHILDTLSRWLDPVSFRPGASSHPYTYDLYGTGMLRFDFAGIMLPDSNVNEPASHGFVQFTLLPRDTTPLESTIENTAAIYFDFNDPVITNTTRHTLGVNFITTGFWHPAKPEYRLTILPNPMQDMAWLEMEGLDEAVELRWVFSDPAGRVIRSETSAGPRLHLQRANLPAGVYFIRVEQRGTVSGWGKIIVR